MKKLGILTMFYGSRNYGGCLQAYALQKYLEQCGADAEQINYLKTVTKSGRINHFRRLLSLSPTVLCEKLGRRLKRKKGAACDESLEQGIKTRAAVFEGFRNDFVQSSSEVYTDQTIAEANKAYDTFIVGSDQVWNEVTANSPYLLSFVAGPKKKVSYAASISQESLSSYAKKAFKSALFSFSAVSVREQRASELLRGCGVESEWVLDPTFLLPREHWETFAGENKYDFPYIFCYFLGEDKEMRLAAQKYAQSRGLKIISLPFLQNRPNGVDGDFGDIKPFDVSPRDFLSLIKNSQAVFTDSFHSTVFSIIFKKQFAVFSRKEGRTNSRLHSLLSVAGLSDRFYKGGAKEFCGYFETLEQINYDLNFENLEKMKESSKAFIEKNVL